MTTRAVIDAINAVFEISGAFFVGLSILKLLNDRIAKGMHWGTIAFFSTWGAWNLYFYPSVGATLSSYGAGGVFVANAIYLSLLWRFRERSLGSLGYSWQAFAPGVRGKRTVNAGLWGNDLGKTVVEDLWPKEPFLAIPGDWESGDGFILTDTGNLVAYPPGTRIYPHKVGLTSPLSHEQEAASKALFYRTSAGIGPGAGKGMYVPTPTSERLEAAGTVWTKQDIEDYQKERRIAAHEEARRKGSVDTGVFL